MLPFAVIAQIQRERADHLEEIVEAHHGIMAIIHGDRPKRIIS